MANRFVLFSLPRCGSTTLMHLLNCHPDIRCCNEPFNVRATDIPDFKPVEDRETLDALLDGLWERYNGIKHVWTPAGWPFPRRSMLNRHLLLRDGHQVILMHRRNLLQQIISNQMGLQSRVFQIRHAKDRDRIAEFRYEPIRAGLVGRTLFLWKKGIKDCRRALAHRGVAFLELAYEDLFDAALTPKQRRQTLDGVFAFLGRNPAAEGIDHLRIGTLFDPARNKINSTDTYLLVPGIERIDRRFGSKENGRLFEASDPRPGIFRHRRAENAGSTCRDKLEGARWTPHSPEMLSQVDPLIIAGFPRSGTSLLRHLCHRHPQMRVTNEFGNYAFIGDLFPVYVARIAKRIKEINGGWPLPAHPVDSRIQGTPTQRRENRRANVHTAVVHLLRLARCGSVRVTLPALVAAARKDDPGARVVGDKFPQYIFMMNRFIELPQLLRLVIYRDCRDVTSSFLFQVRTKWKGRRWIRHMDTAEKIARHWVRAIEIMERHAGYVFAIRYEDLVREPQSELQRLADWLGVEPAGFNARAVRNSSVGKYERGLTVRELDDVLKVAGPTLERLKYPLD